MRRSDSDQKKKLLEELHYHQTLVRVDLRAARAGMRKCKELGKRLRSLNGNKAQNENQISHFIPIDFNQLSLCGLPKEKWQYGTNNWEWVNCPACLDRKEEAL